MLIAKDIHAAYGRKPILKGIGFTARAGDVTAIVGPNGSGKSTLIKALTGDIPCQGTLSLNGRDVTKLESWQLAGIRGVLPQSTPLAFPFTVIEVVRMGLMAGISAARNQLPVLALAEVGLTGYENRFYQELSGGEQQRAQLARVLCQIWDPVDEDGTPRWLFLDEPVSSLDVAHQLQVMQIARRFASNGGGVVMVMHDLNLTALFADQVTLMKSGEVVASGPPHEVISSTPLTDAYGCQIDLTLPIQGGVPMFHPGHVVA